MFIKTLSYTDVNGVEFFNVYDKDTLKVIGVVSQFHVESILDGLNKPQGVLERLFESMKIANARRAVEAAEAERIRREVTEAKIKAMVDNTWDAIFKAVGTVADGFMTTTAEKCKADHLKACEERDAAIAAAKASATSK